MTKKSNDQHESMLRQIMHYSKNRGFKELECILNNFTIKNINNLNIKQQKDLFILLNEDDHILYNYITGVKKIPPHLNKNLIKTIYQSFKN